MWDPIEMHNEPTKSQLLDVAIVGAGVAGNYIAWRLLSEQPNLKIAVIEQSARIGGRLYSEHVNGVKTVAVEHGGMRFSRNHKLLTSLVEHLELPTRPFKSVLADVNPIFVRNHHTSLKQLAAGDRPPYSVPAELGTTDPGEILPASVIAFLQRQAITPGPANDLIHCLDKADFNGKSFSQLSFKEFLHHVCDAEVFNYYNDVHGYWVDTHDNVSARELLLGFLPFVSDSDTITISNGMQSLPLKLSDLAAKSGCQYLLRSRLAAISRSLDRFELAVKSAGSDQSIIATTVVLALPPNRLKSIDGLDQLAPGLGSKLNSVVEIQAIKTHFVYESAWWQDLSITDGEARTDLPMRQCLYMGGDYNQVTASNNNQPEIGANQATPQHSVLLASYTDSGASDFWRSLALTDHPAEHLPASTDQTLACPEPVVRELTAQLERLHGQRIAEPIWASLCDWKQQPSGVATHSWRAGIVSSTAIPNIRHPNSEIPLYICGEAFSQEQGWVNGALRSAEALLRSSFKLTPPSWTDKSTPIDQL